MIYQKINKNFKMKSKLQINNHHLKILPMLFLINMKNDDVSSY